MVGDRRGLACALVAVAVLALSACTGGEAVPEPSSSATTDATAPTAPTPSPSESAVPKPARPLDMDRTDEAGAAAAARYFLSLYSYVMQTGDLGDWDAMTTPTCQFCLGIRDDATSLAEGGGNYSGGEITVISAEVGLHDDGLDAYAVEMTVDQAPVRQTDATGALTLDDTRRSGRTRVEVMNRPAGWGVLAVVNTES